MLKTKKRGFKIICLALTVMMVFSMMPITAAIGEDDSFMCDETREMYRMMRASAERSARQERALGAWELLFTTQFTINHDSSVTYSGKFAGGWLDNDKLYVSITCEIATEFYRELLSDFADVVRFVTATYTLNELNEIRMAVDEILFDRGYQIVSHYVNVQQNRISLRFLELDEETERSIEASLSLVLPELSAALPEMTDARGRSIARTLDMDLFVLSEDSLVVLDTPEYTEVSPRGAGPIGQNVMGGQPIHVGTIGIAGTFVDNGVRVNGFVTHGHSPSMNGMSIRRANSTQQLGQVRRVNFGSWVWGDWSLVRITNGDAITNRLQNPHNPNPAGNVRITHGVRTFYQPPGRILNSFGATSGFREKVVTSGNVVRLIGDPNRGIPPVWIQGLTEARIVHGAVDRGDSGGPVWGFNMNDMTSNTFVGIIVAGIGGIGAHVLFTPYMRFPRYFTARTTD